jgi:hypothetical protein
MVAMSSSHGPSLFERGIPQAIIGGCIGAVFVALLQGRGHLPGGVIVWALGTAAMSFIAWLPNRLLLKGGEAAATAVYMPSGDTTRYVPTFSHIEALEVRGDLDGAARAWADACTEHAGNALVRVKAADFHLRLRKDPSAALALYREARDQPGASRELVRYAQSKIVDLHLGPLADEGRALVELRRLIEAFPDTREADEARAALARIKAKRQDA